ncbi:MAG: DNA-processing protein DprA [Eubacteriales bacterium]|nr:DNA-processing protein DprA [Eubacteriales bacterium]
MAIEDRELMTNALYLENLTQKLRLKWDERRRIFLEGELLTWKAPAIMAHLSELCVPWQPGTEFYEACQAEAAKYEEAGMRITYRGATTWPIYLNSLTDAPLWLWFLGHEPSEINGKATVAVVGARRAIPYSYYLTRKISSRLAVAGSPIISGLAKGVDGTAHQACLDAGGVTVAVMPCGLSQCYPAQHTKLMKDICKQGSVVSEFPPKYPVRKANFHMRNRLISGLATSVVIVQAGSQSGSLITGRVAVDQGREVYVAPAFLEEESYKGSLQLLRDGALILDSLEILDELSKPQPLRLASFAAGWEQLNYSDLKTHTDTPAKVEYSKSASQPGQALSELEQEVLRFLSGKPASRDELGLNFAITPQACNRLVARLELGGWLTYQAAGLTLTEKAISCIYGP